MRRPSHPVNALGIAAIAASLGLPAGAARAQQAQANPPPSFTGMRGTAAATDPLVASPAGASQDAVLDPAPTPTSPPNYGRPRPPADPRAKYAGRSKPPRRALPALTPYPTSAQARQRPVQPLRPGDAAPQPSPNVAVPPPIPRKAAPKVETDPYMPLGVNVGSLRLTPYVEATTGYDSNPNRTQSPASGSWMLRGETGVAVQSDWSVHQLTGAAQFGYSRYATQPDANRPDGQGKLNLRLDITRDTTADFELRGNLTTQRQGTPGIGVNVSDRPIVATFGASAGGTQAIGDLQLGLHGTIDRTDYQNGSLGNGTVVDLANGNYTAFGLLPRLAYQLSPGITPFIEATIDTRRRDQALDTLGFARDSNGLAGRVGTTFELSRQLTGQIAAGYAERSYADTRLKSIAAPTLDASLVWTASPLTTVTLRGATTINETTVTNSSGSVNRTASVEISHALMRNLTLGAVGAIGFNDYSGVSLHETTFTGTLKADYALSRSVVVRGSFTHERLNSTATGSDYTANVFLLGLRLQR